MTSLKKTFYYYYFVAIFFFRLRRAFWGLLTLFDDAFNLFFFVTARLEMTTGASINAPSLTQRFTNDFFFFILKYSIFGK